MSATRKQITIGPFILGFKYGLGCEERVRVGFTWADQVLGPLDDAERDHMIGGFLKVFSVSCHLYLRLWGDGKPTTYPSNIARRPA